MKTRTTTLLRVPLYCAAASWISYYLTVYFGGHFFTARSVGSDGVTVLSVDPLRSAIFNGVLFALVLLVGGLWVFRNMRKTEIAASAALATGIYLALVLAQILLTDFPLSLGMQLAKIQNWTGILNSCLYKTGFGLKVSAILSSFAPFLFVPFGKK